ncbi:sugar ABC transporter permease [Eubacteriales bacterium OttesenSCG-928-A19]|nr:sugar ABC transporter permease [Eubacteriales bacterium OttesenSCG-928-A19]
MLMTGNRRERWIPYAVITPALLLIVIFKLYPILNTIINSFIRKESFSFRNYQYIFEDPIFWNSLWVTFKFNIIITPVQIIISIGMALLVNVKMRGTSVFRTIYYLPVTISMTVAAIIWNLMLNPSTGVVNSFLRLLGFSAQPFFTGVSQALGSIMLLASWKGCGYWMMFLLAGLQGIDEEIYESARIDGANWLQTTLRITLPLLKNSLTFVIISDTTSNLLLFAPMFMITKGGPQMSTNVLMYEIYKSSFIYADQARANALMTIMLLIVAAIVITQFAMLNRDSDVKRVRGKRGAKA